VTAAARSADFASVSLAERDCRRGTAVEYRIAASSANVRFVAINV
jgi:hypothetical protein